MDLPDVSGTSSRIPMQVEVQNIMELFRWLQVVMFGHVLCGCQ